MTCQLASGFDNVTRTVVVGGAIIVIILCAVWWKKHSEEVEAHDSALPKCVVRLGSEKLCNERLDEHHQECFTYTYKPGMKYSRGFFDEAAYLECIVLEPDPWLAQRAAKKR